MRSIGCTKGFRGVLAAENYKVHSLALAGLPVSDVSLTHRFLGLQRSSKESPRPEGEAGWNPSHAF